MNDVTIPNNNFRQLLLTGAIFISGAIYTIVAIFSYNEARHNTKVEEHLNQIDSALKYQEQKNADFQKAVKDSLKMK